MTLKAIQHRPAISNVLVKASANIAFRTKLLNNAQDILTELNLPPEDLELLTDIQAPTLKEYARQLKTKLMTSA